MHRLHPAVLILAVVAMPARAQKPVRTERLVVFELMEPGEDGEFLTRREQEEMIRRFAPVHARPAPKGAKAISVSDWTARVKQWAARGEQPVFGIAVRIRPDDPNDARLLVDTAKTATVTAARSACCTALAQYGLGAIPGLLELIGDERQVVQTVAQFVFSGLRFSITTRPTPTEVSRATDVLVGALTHANVTVRLAAARTLGWPFLDHARVMPELLAALEDEEDEVRYWIAQAINRCRPRAVTVAPALFKCCASKSARARWSAATTLRLHVRFPEPEDVAVAVAHLSHQDAHVRTVAAEVLARLGARAKPGVESLVTALQDEAPEVRDAAALALAKVDPANEATVPGLIAVVKRGSAAAGTSGARRRIPAPGAITEPDPVAGALNLEAVELLGQLGERAKPAVEVLASRMRRPDGVHVLEVVQALRRIGPYAGEALPQLEEAMKDKSSYTALVAAIAWIKAGGDKAKAVPLIVASLGGNNGFLHGEAARAVQVLGSQDPTALPALRAGLVCKTPDVRRMAAGAIASLPGDALAKLRPDLERALKDGDETVRKFARQALEKLPD